MRKHHVSIYFLKYLENVSWFWLVISNHYHFASAYAIFKPKHGVISIRYMANVGLLFGHASGMCALNVSEVSQIYFLGICAAIQPVGHLNIKMLSYQYRDPHIKDKTVLWLSYL